eukprot:m.330080 g.330080  ORF g.330080 m.330080 type:complete len:338 (+) comp19759_c1_seq17:1131-2144(+)
MAKQTRVAQPRMRMPFCRCCQRRFETLKLSCCTAKQGTCIRFLSFKNTCLQRYTRKDWKRPWSRCFAPSSTSVWSTAQSCKRFPPPNPLPEVLSLSPFPHVVGTTTLELHTGLPACSLCCCICQNFVCSQSTRPSLLGALPFLCKCRTHLATFRPACKVAGRQKNDSSTGVTALLAPFQRCARRMKCMVTKCFCARRNWQAIASGGEAFCARVLVSAMGLQGRCWPCLPCIAPLACADICIALCDFVRPAGRWIACRSLQRQQTGSGNVLGCLTTLTVSWRAWLVCFTRTFQLPDPITHPFPAMMVPRKMEPGLSNADVSDVSMHYSIAVEQALRNH